jgi:hypothetical protein
MWSLFPVAKGYGIPGFIHGDDRYLLTDPGAGVSPETAAALPTMLGTDDIIAEPEELRIVTDRMSLTIAGLDFVVRHAPGHTWGSVLFDFQTDEHHVFTGDVLFKGAIGRTDLANGSPEQATSRLASQCHSALGLASQALIALRATGQPIAPGAAPAKRCAAFSAAPIPLKGVVKAGRLNNKLAFTTTSWPLQRAAARRRPRTATRGMPTGAVASPARTEQGLPKRSRSG